MSDLISRQDAIDAVKHAWAKGLEPSQYIEELPSAPTVDPVKHGKWIEQEHSDWMFSKEYRCSECGKYRLVTIPAGWEWNYYPHCGAKMDGENDEAD